MSVIHCENVLGIKCLCRYYELSYEILRRNSINSEFVKQTFCVCIIHLISVQCEIFQLYFDRHHKERNILTMRRNGKLYQKYKTRVCSVAFQLKARAMYTSKYEIFIYLYICDLCFSYSAFFLLGNKNIRKLMRIFGDFKFSIR